LVKKAKIESIPREYAGREQAYIKHYILKCYLQRLFMIIGLQRHLTINYVDCFAGPWQDETEDLSDTSIGISIQKMLACAQELSEQFGRPVTFRALYIEQNPQAYSRLHQFLEKQNHANLELNCLEGDYTSLCNDIVRWTQGHFTFFFVDPKGWKKIISANTMHPLLKLQNTEFLINLMYDFANRAVSIDKHNEDFIELLGELPKLPAVASPLERKELIVSLYRENINSHYRGHTAAVPIERPGKDRVHYFLVYLTRHPKGITVFKEEAEKMTLVQRVTQAELKFRQQQEKSLTLDLFGNSEDIENLVVPVDNRASAKAYLLQRLSNGPLIIDLDCWADFLESTPFYPSDFQLAMKELVTEERVINLDSDIRRRRSAPIHIKKKERWHLQQ